MKKLILGLVIGFLCVLLMGASYDKTYFQHDPIYLDGFGPYLGTGSDAQMKWNASGYVDWNVTGDVDMDLTSSFTMDFSAATDGSGGFKVTTNIPTGQQLYGGFYTHAHLEGTTDGTVAALRVKTSMDSDSVPGNDVYGVRITVEEVGADQSSGNVIPLIIETYLDAGGDDPLTHYMMRFNTSLGAETPDAWFIAGNPASIAWTGSSQTGGTKTGGIKIKIAGSGAGDDVHYIRTYDSSD